ncbi:MAG: DnaD domain protein [Clostridiales bacterium]|jgi:DNA replication protein DnaD|nr:DnaD domain protein [Clostridiales bacterium]
MIEFILKLCDNVSGTKKKQTNTNNCRFAVCGFFNEAASALKENMSLFGFSSDFIIDSVTVIDNIFINEYLPKAKDGHVKVYIYGLYLACHGGGSVEELMRALSMTYEEIFEALHYFELTELIEITSKTPLEIKFISLRDKDNRPQKKYKPSKYAAFNSALQNIFPQKMLMPNEFGEYYDVMESLNIMPEAMLMIASYCINVKSENVSFQYILAVARDWAKNGVTTPELAEEKIKELELLTGDMKDIFNALGKKIVPDFSDREYLAKWKKNWGFSMPAILFAAKRCKNKGGTAKLDALLESYHKLNIRSVSEIEEYSARRDDLYSLATEINKKIGVYYESLDNVVETYTVHWAEMGFDSDVLLLLANYCFLKGLRRLSDMDALIVKLYKMGRLTKGAINQYIDGLIKDDGFIKKLYAVLDLNKFVTQNDRETVNIWLGAWGFSEDIILFAAEAAKDKTHPIAYLNQILSGYKQNGVSTLEKAKEFSQSQPQKSDKKKAPKDASKDFAQREYSKEELSALFEDLNNIDKIEF